MQSNISVYLAGKVKSAELLKRSIILSGALLFPMIIHLLPNFGERPLGSIILAMFIFPMLALKYGGRNFSLIISISAPVANYLLTGHPGGGLLLPLTCQITLFVLIISVNQFRKVLLIPAGFIAAKIFTDLLFHAHSMFQQLVYELPGLLLLTFIAYLIREKHV